MRTLVVVLTDPRPEAGEILQRNWPWIKRGGCPIAVAHHEQEVGYHPVDADYLLQAGGPPDQEVHRWLGRFLKVCEAAVYSCRKTGSMFERFVFIEGDVIFIREIPNDARNGGTLAGGNSEGFVASHFLHCPWMFSAAELLHFIHRAPRMMAIGLNERGFIDRFLGLYEDIHGPIFTLLPNYSRNTIDQSDIRAIRASNAWAVHGVKDSATLKAITEGL